MKNKDKSNIKKGNFLFIVPMHLSFESFINPPDNARHFKKKDGKSYNSLATDLPLGPLSISSFIKKHIDINVKLIDFNVEINALDSFDFKDYLTFCLKYLNSIDFNPDIVGISSLFSPSYHNFIDCAIASRKIWKDALIIGGGNIPTNSHNKIFKEHGANKIFDGLCFGEGEKPVLELLKSKDKKKFMNESNSWITFENFLNEDNLYKHDFIEDLDDIPFYDYDICNLDNHGMNPVMSAYASHSDQNGFHIMTSRGCPFKCTFCASHKVHGRKMRYHSVERIEKDLENLKKNFNAKTIIFQDDHLMSDRDRVFKILKIIKKLDLKAIFQNGLTLYALDMEMLKAFYDAGIRQLVLPVESGSEKVLKHQMKKPLKMRISKKVAEDCRNLGIYTNTNILIGMPGETKDDIKQALENLKSVPSNWFHVVCASPIVGSEMHEHALKNGFISGETLGADYRFAVINTNDFSSDYIQKMQYIFNLDLNFVNNNDMKYKNYHNALHGFKNTIRVKEDHCFAHYFISIAYKNLKKIKESEFHLKRAIELSKFKFWKKFIRYFKLKELYI